MPTYLYGPNAALDVETGLLLGNTTGMVYGVTDITYSAPLLVTDLNGIEGVEVNAYQGITQSFRVEDNASVVWVDSNSGTPVALDALGGNVPPGGGTGQVLSKTSELDFEAQWVDQTGGSGGGTIDGIPGLRDALNEAGKVLVLNPLDPLPEAATLPNGTLVVRLLP